MKNSKGIQPSSIVLQKQHYKLVTLEALLSDELAGKDQVTEK